MAGGDVFAGRWGASECVITKDANSHLVSRKNPGGMMNGTFPADLRDGKLEMSQTLYGVIVHSKNEAVIYFVGGKYKRVKP